MKKTLFLLFIVSFSTAFAQTSLPSLVDDVKKPTIEEVDLLSIPPLDSLYKWAEQTSFIIKQQDALIEKTEADYKTRERNMDGTKCSVSSGRYCKA